MYICPLKVLMFLLDRYVTYAVLDKVKKWGRGRRGGRAFRETYETSLSEKSLYFLSNKDGEGHEQALKHLFLCQQKSFCAR